jgi:hypothetical protein
MNKFERWILKKIIAKQVRQGEHYTNIQELYRLIRNAAVKEFLEDNTPTINSFLQEAFESVQDEE